MGHQFKPGAGAIALNRRPELVTALVTPSISRFAGVAVATNLGYNKTTHL
jgi:hypothetical protein